MVIIAGVNYGRRPPQARNIGFSTRATKLGRFVGGAARTKVGLGIAATVAQAGYHMGVDGAHMYQNPRVRRAVGHGPRLRARRIGPAIRAEDVPLPAGGLGGRGRVRGMFRTGTEVSSQTNMPPRRRSTVKRGRRRTSRMPVASYARVPRRMTMGPLMQPEMKHFDRSYVLVPPASAQWGLYSIGPQGIIHGTGPSNRIGQKITLHKVEITCVLGVDDTDNIPAGGCNVIMKVLQDNSPNGAAITNPTWLDSFATAGNNYWYTPRNTDTTNRVKEVATREHHVQNMGEDNAGNSIVNIDTTSKVVLYPKKVVRFSGNLDNISSLINYNLFAAVIQTRGIPVPISAFTMNMVVRYHYTDS